MPIRADGDAASVMPAKAGIQARGHEIQGFAWMPAFAGMTKVVAVIADLRPIRADNESRENDGNGPPSGRLLLDTHCNERQRITDGRPGNRQVVFSAWEDML